jgi:hypothetical protein
MPVEDYQPTVDEIGARLGARTLTLDGGRVGTFNSETRPTAQAVTELITDAVAVVSSAVGATLDSEYWRMARTAVIAYTCMSIELGYYPESTDATDSAYRAFKERFTQQIEFIETSLNQRRPNERRIVSVRQGTLVGVHGSRLDPWATDLFP